MTSVAIMLALFLAPIFIVLVWIGLQLKRLVGILSFLSIRWQEQDDLVKHALITHDIPDGGDEDDEDEA